MKATLEYDLEVAKDKKAFQAAQDPDSWRNKADKKDQQDEQLRRLTLKVAQILENPNLDKLVRQVLKPIYEEMKGI